MACQGVGGPYDATLLANTLPLGTTSAAIGEARRLFNLANSKCPDTTVVAGGYSQGAAVMHGAIPGLSSAVRDQIAGVVLYGDTRNLQTGGSISNYPDNRLNIICLPGDPVCSGTLIVNAVHLS